ncbi:MAG TPA: AsnC family transcriptional regulator [Candidatus Nanoarchaeia archaeon]|nr:AsnC family transcriptional regulator [Candidatus Nanoarchaeia archaeon]
MTNIDLKDRKLLHSLYTNCRRSDRSIGNEIGQSKQLVHYRINNLEKRKVILGYTIGIDKSKLGYQRFVVFFHFSHTTTLSEAIKHLRNFEQVSTLIECLGKWDLYATVWTKDHSDLYEFLQKLVTILDIEYWSVLAVVTSRMTLYQILNDSPEKLPPKAPSSIIKINDIDKKILDILKRNSREKLMNISRMVGLSMTAVRHRIKKLCNSGVIIRFFAGIDMSKLGYQEIQFLCNISPSKYTLIEEFTKHLEKNNRISYTLKTIGKWNICFSMYIKSQEELRAFTKDVNARFKELLINYDTLIIGHVV